MPAALDLSGKRFGHLTVVKRVGSKNGHSLWECRCDCGNTTDVVAGSLTQGLTRSCGCLDRERRTTHGESKSRLYEIWLGMRQRCSYQHHKDYKNYGGRGIRVCDEWQSFATFHDWAMSHGYDPDAPYGKCTIDRINVDGNYEPSNCRFVDLETQANNRRKRRS
jgi:hypothetical protein